MIQALQLIEISTTNQFPNHYDLFMIRVLGLSLYGPMAASHRVRLSQFKPGLLDAGISLDIQSLLDDTYLLQRFLGKRPSLRRLVAAYVQRILCLHQANSYDLAIVYADLLPYLPRCLERYLLQIPFIYDCDDAFFLKYRTDRLGFINSFLGPKIDRLMASAVAVTAGNDYLVSYARHLNNNVVLIPSVVDTEHFLATDLLVRESSPQPFTVGWIGSPSTAPYLELLVEPLEQLARERSVRLLVVGGPAPSIQDVDIIQHPWTLKDELSLIHQFDIGVMPLPDNSWTRGKCAYKLIQCMACGIPVIASPVGANVSVVPSDCGILADTSSQWLDSFRHLASDPHARRSMGISARKWVEERYSLQSALPLLTELINRVSNVILNA